MTQNAQEFHDPRCPYLHDLVAIRKPCAPDCPACLWEAMTPEAKDADVQYRMAKEAKLKAEIKEAEEWRREIDERRKRILERLISSRHRP